MKCKNSSKLNYLRIKLSSNKSWESEKSEVPLKYRYQCNKKVFSVVFVPLFK